MDRRSKTGGNGKKPKPPSKPKAPPDRPSIAKGDWEKK